MNAATLRHFIGRAQLQVIGAACRGEERDFFRAKLAELEQTIATMPRVYQQDGLGDAAIAHLHYFTAGYDCYITERDTSAEQHQAFGWASFGGDGEVGYISILEAIEAGAELDLHFRPATLRDITTKRERTHAAL